MLGAHDEGHSDHECDRANRDRCVTSATHRLHARNDHDEEERHHRRDPTSVTSTPSQNKTP
jgi:hypothetical protein